MTNRMERTASAELAKVSQQIATLNATISEFTSAVNQLHNALTMRPYVKNVQLEGAVNHNFMNVVPKAEPVNMGLDDAQN